MKVFIFDSGDRVIIGTNYKKTVKDWFEDTGEDLEDCDIYTCEASRGMEISIGTLKVNGDDFRDYS